MTKATYLTNEVSDDLLKKDIETLKRVAQWIIKLDNENHAKEDAEVLGAMMEAKEREE